MRSVNPPLLKILRRYATRCLFPPTLAYSLVRHRLSEEWRWWDHVDETVVLGALALPRWVRRLHEEGIRGVVNLCDEYRGPLRQYGSMGIVQLHLPTVDFTPPELHDVEAAIAFIEGYKGRGEKVYVHCKAGRGRSATVVLCWLVRELNITPAEAQAKLRAIRPRVHATLDQTEVVCRFAAENEQAGTRARSAPGPGDG